MSGSETTGLQDRIGTIQPLDEATKRRAARAVHRHATGAADAALLLDALGLGEEE